MSIDLTSVANAAAGEAKVAKKRGRKPGSGGGKGSRVRMLKPFPVPEGGLTGPVTEINSDEFTYPRKGSFVAGPRAIQWAMESEIAWHKDKLAKLEERVKKLAARSDADIENELARQKAEKQISGVTAKAIASGKDDELNETEALLMAQLAAIQAAKAAKAIES